MIQAPIGYYVDICSQTSFVFGEEDVVMQNLTKVFFFDYSLSCTRENEEQLTMFRVNSKNGSREIRKRFT